MTIERKHKNSYEAFLMDYAAGTLCPALSMVMAAHVSINPDAYRQMKLCEKIGGALLETACAPEPLSAGCLEKLMARIETKKSSSCSNQSPCPPLRIGDIEMPRVLQDLIPEGGENWHPVYRGIEIMHLKKRGPMRFDLMRIAPNVKTPHHAHRGLEITLVLHGAFDDENGRYGRGDMIVLDEGTHHAPVADHQHGCVCLSVTAAPVRLTGWLGALINPFLR